MARKALGRGLDALIPGAGDDQTSAASRRSKPGKPGSAGSVSRVRLSEIRPNPQQPRRDFDTEALEDLAASIEQKGVLQPVLLRTSPDEEGYELVAGERRLRAAEMAGLNTIPAIVYEVDSDEEMLELALIENVQRENLNPIDTARAYLELAEGVGLTQEAIAERVGKSRTAVANTLRLLALPEKVQEMVRQGALSEGHGRALLGLETSGEQSALAKRIVAKDLSVRDTERLVRESAGSGEKKGRKGRGTLPLSPRMQEIQEELQRALGTKVTITGSEKKGRVQIVYYSVDDLTRICDRLDISLD